MVNQSGNDGDLSKALGEWGEQSTTTPSSFSSFYPQGTTTPSIRVATGSGETICDGSSGSTTTTAVINPQMLVTYKQYAPHGQPILFTNPDSGSGGSSGSSTSGDGSGLLSAQDKIKELGRVVEQQKGEMERMMKEMEDVQAEKVSMEYLLREKLERLVQNEIEERLSVYRKEGQDQQSLLLQQRMMTLRQELERKSSEVVAGVAREQRLQAEVYQLRGGGGGAGSNSSSSTRSSKGGAASSSSSSTTTTTSIGETMALRQQCSVLLKERQAVTTIMEDKIRVLLENVTTSSTTVLREAPGVAGGAAGQALRSNVMAMTKLVNAFIAALRNSSGEEGGGGGEEEVPIPASGGGSSSTTGGGHPSNSSSHRNKGPGSGSGGTSTTTTSTSGGRIYGSRSSGGAASGPLSCGHHNGSAYLVSRSIGG